MAMGVHNRVLWDYVMSRNADFSKKTAYKRNAFGNHSKGIINLNLKLNYEKIFCFLQLYFVSVTTENINVFPSEIF
jgi:hypothetical protein